MMRHPIDCWLEQAWERTTLVALLQGGHGGQPLDERRIFGFIEKADALAELQQLSSTGVYTGDICRCPGHLTIALYDRAGAVIGQGSVHGRDTVSWERGRFGDNLEVADPVGLALLLSRQGAAGELAGFSHLLAQTIGLGEGRPQFREPGHGRHGAALLATRQVPASLWSALVQVGRLEVGQLPQEQVDKLSGLLAAELPDPAHRALGLLRWLGSLPDLAEAEYGEGILARRLLEDLAPLQAASALPQPLEARIVLGLLRWAAHHRDAPDLGPVVGPGLRAALD